MNENEKFENSNPEEANEMRGMSPEIKDIGETIPVKESTIDSLLDVVTYKIGADNMEKADKRAMEQLVVPGEEAVLVLSRSKADINPDELARIKFNTPVDVDEPRGPQISEHYRIFQNPEDGGLAIEKELETLEGKEANLVEENGEIARSGLARQAEMLRKKQESGEEVAALEEEAALSSVSHQEAMELMTRIATAQPAHRNRQ